MKKLFTSLILAFVLMVGSLGLPVLSSFEQPQAVKSVASVLQPAQDRVEALIGPIQEDASAGATNCMIWKSGWKSGGKAYGYVQWNCGSSWQRDTSIGICLTNLTTGTNLGCQNAYNVSTSSSMTYGAWASSWSSIQMRVKVCETSWGGPLGCTTYWHYF